MECNPETNTCNAHCCRILVLTVPQMTREFKDYYTKRGCEIDGNNILIPAPCPYLENNKCKLHGTGKKPMLCRLFNAQNTKGYYIPRDCVYHRKYKG
jgi:Fe-S-cluster containining protein